jgi:hypothetical protein
VAWYDRIIRAIASSIRPQNNPPEEPAPRPNESEQIQEPTWLERVLGNEPTSNRDQVARDLQDFQPQDDEQGLFYLGFVDKNLSPEARREARDQFQEQYGRLNDEQWARWRRQRGYA